MFARRRGGPSTSTLMVLALHSFIDHASHDAARHAVTLLGLDATGNPHQAARHARRHRGQRPRPSGRQPWPAAPPKSRPTTRRAGVTAWYQLLIDHGWQPDEWTAERLAEAARRAEPTDTNEGHDDEPSSQGDNDTVGAHILFPNPLHQLRRSGRGAAAGERARDNHVKP